MPCHPPCHPRGAPEDVTQMEAVSNQSDTKAL